MELVIDLAILRWQIMGSEKRIKQLPLHATDYAASAW